MTTSKTIKRQSKSPPKSRKRRQPQSRQKKGFAKLAAIATLLLAMGAIAGGVWLSLLMIINPDAGLWLNSYLPSWTRIPVAVRNPPQTLAEIKTNLARQGFQLGKPISVASELLIPLWVSPPSCREGCAEIVQLRVYQPVTSPNQSETKYRLVSEVELSEISETFVVSPLLRQNQETVASANSQPLQEISLLKNAPEPGIWLNLSSELVRNDTNFAYGLIVHYNPEQMHLSQMLQWTSPTGEFPRWQQVTGSKTQELVVNHTIGLEPRFKVYRIQPRNFVPNPIYLEEVLLNQPPPEIKLFLDDYRQALALTNQGLFSPALQRLLSIKQQTPSEAWSLAAEAQLDTIRMHAAITQSQCQQSWASPIQQIFACVTDGRPGDALAAFQAGISESSNFQEIINFLKKDDRQIWTRTQAALKVTPNDENWQAWGALILAVQKNREAAIAWLKESSSSQPTPRITELLNLLDVATVSQTGSYISKIVGAAVAVETVEGEWLQPTVETNLPPLQPQQSWYQIQVTNFYDGKRWRKAPFSDLQLASYAPGKQLWRLLGLDIDPWIKVTVLTADGRLVSFPAAVQAVQFSDGSLKLLALGDKPQSNQPRRFFAHTNSAFRWLEPGSVTLRDLYKIQPEWVSLILPALWREVKTSETRSLDAVPSVPELIESMGHWSVRPVDLTGNEKPEALLTIYEELAPKTQSEAETATPTTAKNQYRPRSLIFADSGEILYNEFRQDTGSSLAAIADFGDKTNPSLLIGISDNYQLKRWSDSQRRFE
ncbi:MAG: hypothetical protein SAJ37_11905 [Oscillatoria sp. PMC 1068.18]|nr:hypothetical protein [Oscillatoria sp. PMC 1076.18]MEC4989445.1 hypothetical protein [Oscillatoria sp. PMC 1068.18]